MKTRYDTTHTSINLEITHMDDEDSDLFKHVLRIFSCIIEMIRNHIRQDSISISSHKGMSFYTLFMLYRIGMFRLLSSGL